MSCSKLFKIIHVDLGTSGGIIVNVQFQRTSVFIVNYHIFVEVVFADIGQSK
jgi:hypothetical protein